MSRHGLSTNLHSTGAHKIPKLETTQISINKRQTRVYPYFTTAKTEPKKFSSTTTWWISEYGTEGREEKHKCMLYNFIVVEFWKWQNKSATESWSEVAWGWGAGCDCAVQEGVFWGKGYVLYLFFFFFKRFCILIVVVVTFVKTQLSITMGTFCCIQILPLKSCCLREFTLCTGAFWVWGPAGVPRTHEAGPDSVSWRFQMPSHCVCVCVCDDT